MVIYFCLKNSEQGIAKLRWWSGEMPEQAGKIEKWLFWEIRPSKRNGFIGWQQLIAFNGASGQLVIQDYTLFFEMVN